MFPTKATAAANRNSNSATNSTINNNIKINSKQVCNHKRNTKCRKCHHCNRRLLPTQAALLFCFACVRRACVCVPRPPPTAACTQRVGWCPRCHPPERKVIENGNYNKAILVIYSPKKIKPKQIKEKSSPRFPKFISIYLSISTCLFRSVYITLNSIRLFF